MRLASVVLGLTVLTACEADPVQFEHQGSVEAATRGVAFLPDGNDGHAGMFGTTCAFDARTGELADDSDFPSEEDEVQDSGADDSGDIVLVTTPDSVHLLRPDGFFSSSSEVAVPGVEQARLLRDGLVVLRDQGDCTVDFLRGGGDASVSLPDDLCAGGTLTVDRSTGTAWVGKGDVYRVDGEAAEVVAEGADLAVWDAHADALYVAKLGDAEVRALEADGSERWTVQLDHPVRALEDMGTLAAVAVMTETNGGGELVLLDGYTGELRGDLGTPSATDELVSSDSGDVMAVILAETVHLFQVGF